MQDETGRAGTQMEADIGRVWGGGHAMRSGIPCAKGDKRGRVTAMSEGEGGVGDYNNIFYRTVMTRGSRDNKQQLIPFNARNLMLG